VRSTRSRLVRPTPGPWEVAESAESNSYKIDKGSELGIRIYGRTRTLPTGETVTVKRTLANAKLVASAPDLLSALQTLLDAIKKHGKENGPENPVSDEDARRLISAIRGGLDAVDKAKGGAE
jgi:hypothetical protein